MGVQGDVRYGGGVGMAILHGILTKMMFSIVVPYIHDLGERFKRTCKNKGKHVHFKGTHTIKTLLMAPKDKDDKLQKSGGNLQIQMPTHKLS